MTIDPAMSPTGALRCAALFDGKEIRNDMLVEWQAGRITALRPSDEAEVAGAVELPDGIVAPGFVDLQVNGGGGVLFNDAPSLDTLATMAQAHAALGATSILPTLISDRPEITHAAIEAAKIACSKDLPGICGLHLEGPHLARAGAHDPTVLRPMTADDFAALCEAAKELPVLMLTVAPEMVSPEQIVQLIRAGAIVALGHTDAGYETCMAAIAAGAKVFTHLFNAMSPMTSREPGAVGAALATGAVSAGLIADGIHVHPATIAAALRAKAGPGQLFLVSDAMATAASDIGSFTLGDRQILRQENRLTLADGTLAGAHLALTDAIALIERCGASRAAALAMASSIPARVAGLGSGEGTLEPGAAADIVWIDADGALARIWQAGQTVAPYPNRT